jgi:hypothetical protein
MGDFYTLATTGASTRNINGNTIIEITDVTDFPGGTGAGVVINLAANTTYVICGLVDLQLDTLNIQADNVAIVGRDRNKDRLEYTGSGTMITVGDITLATNTEYNFTLDCLQLSAPDGKILDAANLDITEPNGDIFGRTAVLSITNCEIRNTQDVWTIIGFELVDLLNNLIWFCTGSIGCQFQSVRHIEMTSNETFNWYLEGSNPKAFYHTGKMIQILDDVISTGLRDGVIGNSPGPSPPTFWTGGGTLTNGGIVTGQPVSSVSPGTGSGATADVQIVLGVIGVTITSPGSGYVAGDTIEIPAYTLNPGVDSNWTAPIQYTLTAEDLNNQFNAVVNITGAIIHPEDNQVGLKVNDASETKFGTITSNTFIPAGLLTPTTIPAGTGALAEIDYDIQNSYIIQANQKIRNGNALGTMVISGSHEFALAGLGSPVVIKGSNALAPGFTPTFPVEQRVVSNAADCSFTYNSKQDGNFVTTVNVTVNIPPSGSGFVTIRLRQNGTAITTSAGTVEIKSGNAESLSFSLLGLASLDDVFDLEVECDVSATVEITDLTWNGYQF